MLLVHLEVYDGKSLFRGELWLGIGLYTAAGGNPKAAIERALVASQEAWKGPGEWLAQFDPDDRVRASVYEVHPDTLLDKPVYQETFRLHERCGKP